MKIWMGPGLNSKTSFTDVNHATSSFALFCSSSCLVSYANITFSRCCSEATHGLNVRPLTTICLIHSWISVVCRSDWRAAEKRIHSALVMVTIQHETEKAISLQFLNNRKAEPPWPLTQTDRILSKRWYDAKFSGFQKRTFQALR